MTRRTLIPTAPLVALIAVLGFDAADRASAAEPEVISSDAAARFMPLEISKSFVIELPKDIGDVLVTDPTIVSTFVRTGRRAYITAKAIGQANIYFYDVDGRQMAAYDVWVTALPPPNSASRKELIVVYRAGVGFRHYNCTFDECVEPDIQKNPLVEQPALEVTIAAPK